MLDRRSTPRRLTTAPTVTDQKVVEFAGLLALVGLLLVGVISREWWLPSSAPPRLSAAAPLDRLASPGSTVDPTGTGTDSPDAAPSLAVGPSGVPGLCWQFRTGGLISEGPAVVDGAVYLGSWDGSVYALDAATGALRWRFPTGHRVDAAPVIGGGAVYVASTAGFVVALDAASGQELWRLTTVSKPTSALLLIDDGLFIVSGAGGAQPAAADGTVYAGGGSETRYLQVVDATSGFERWRAALDRNGVSAFDADTGHERWFLDTGKPVRSSPVVDGDAVYAEDGLLYRIDAVSGALRWQTQPDNSRWEALAAGESLLLATVDDAPTIVDGMGRVNGWLLAVDTATGEERWRVPTGGPVWSAPVAAGGTAYVGGYDGTVFAVDAATGRERWRVPLDEKLLGTTVAGGRVYTGASDGSLFAIGDGCRGPAGDRAGWRDRPRGGLDAVVSTHLRQLW